MDYINNDFKHMIELDYRLITAEILYHFPDHPSLLQSYIWQQLDATPDFPQLVKFLNFWERSIEGKLHSVKVTACSEVRASSYLGRGEAIIVH